jgi:hypothetical protein
MLKGKPIQIEGVTIYIIAGKAYIPSKASYSSVDVHADPVYITDLNIEDMTLAIEKARESGRPELSEPESRKQTLKQARNVMLKATKTRSWKQLARSGPAYMITWLGDEIMLSMSQLDNQGRYEFPKSKEQIFPSDTPLEMIIKAILIDVEKQQN